MAPHEDSSLATYLDGFSTNYYFAQLLHRYEETREHNELVGRVDAVVGRTARSALSTAAALYERVYAQPRRRVGEAIGNGVERTKEVAVHGTTLTLGAAVVSVQLGLALSAGALSLGLGALGAGQRAGRDVARRAREAEESAARQLVRAQQTALVPVRVAVKQTNSVLDVVEGIVEGGLAVHVETQPEDGLTKRISSILAAVSDGLTSRAHSQLIDPAHEQALATLEHLKKSFTLVDSLRERRDWAACKAGELSQSLVQLKSRAEQEASKYRIPPEEALMRSIQRTSATLNSRLEQLREKNSQVLGDGSLLEGAISYVQRLESSIAGARDIYGLRDEVLTEARSQLSSLYDRLRPRPLSASA